MTIFERTSKTFPTYNMAIPDQFRVDQFIKEFEDTWGEGGLPSMLTVILPNDHGAGWVSTMKLGPALHFSLPRSGSVAVGIMIEGPIPQITLPALEGEKKPV